jgi:hypothetical protein
MSPTRRALIIAGIGPALQALGFVWESLHIALSHWHTPLSARHLLYEPGVLLIVVGFLVTLVALPIALDVVRASEADVAIPQYAPQPSPQSTRSPRRRARAD